MVTFTAVYDHAELQDPIKHKHIALTLEKHCLAEVTAHVVATHCLHSEQVENVRGHVVDNGFLLTKARKSIDSVFEDGKFLCEA